MFKLLGCLIFLLFFGFLVVVAPLLHIAGRLFGFGRSFRPDPTSDPAAGETRRDASAHGGMHEARSGGKIYDGSEGEYVDFEDIPTTDAPER